jgi:hypothetical protein
MDYSLGVGQRMIVKPNNFGKYADMGHRVLVLDKVISTEKGIIAKDCSYVDELRVHYIDIPLFLLWRIADKENLLDMHEAYIYSINL